MKLTTHLQLVPRSRKYGSIHPLPYTPSWRSDQLVKNRNNFTFITNASHYTVHSASANWFTSTNRPSMPWFRNATRSINFTIIRNFLTMFAFPLKCHLKYLSVVSNLTEQEEYKSRFRPTFATPLPPKRQKKRCRITQKPTSVLLPVCQLYYIWFSLCLGWFVTWILCWMLSTVWGISDIHTVSEIEPLQSQCEMGEGEMGSTLLGPS
jgi:hypothetical protein